MALNLDAVRNVVLAVAMVGRIGAGVQEMAKKYPDASMSPAEHLAASDEVKKEYDDMIGDLDDLVKVFGDEEVEKKKEDADSLNSYLNKPRAEDQRGPDPSAKAADEVLGAYRIDTKDVAGSENPGAPKTETDKVTDNEKKKEQDTEKGDQQDDDLDKFLDQLGGLIGDNADQIKNTENVEKVENADNNGGVR